MESSHSHWRPPPGKDPPPDQFGQSTNHPDVHSGCMSQSHQRFDSNGSKSNFAESDDDQNKSASSSENSFADTNGSLSVQCQQKDEGPKVRNLKSNLLKMLKRRYKEIFVVIVLLISLFSALNNGYVLMLWYEVSKKDCRSLTTRKAASPVKFFDPFGSLVVDFEYGQLREASVLASKHEVTMTMYYAPWDLESQLLKREFELIAEHFDGQINFVAINCWWPDGECSKKFSIKRFPVLNAFLRGRGDVEYRGPLVASYIIPFLDNLLDPVTTINNDGDLLELRSKHDVSST